MQKNKFSTYREMWYFDVWLIVMPWYMKIHDMGADLDWKEVCDFGQMLSETWNIKVHSYNVITKI